MDLLRTKGNAHFRSGRYTEAIATFTYALEIYPKTCFITPPLSLLTNRAAAYISEGNYQAALADMQSSLTYPCSDAEGNVKRLGRLSRCYLALGKLEGQEVTETIRHMQNQLVLLERMAGTDKTYYEGKKSLKEVETGIQAMLAVNTAREKAEWQAVLEGLDHLLTLKDVRKDFLPQEWSFIRAETLCMLGRVEEASKLVM